MSYFGSNYFKNNYWATNYWRILVVVLPSGAGEIIAVQLDRRIVYLGESNRVVYVRFGE